MCLMCDILKNRGELMNIYDIAKKCGVSIATVSRVLNNSNKVNQKTKEKILAVMNEENYTPNAFARGLGLGSMRMIGLVCTDVADLYYAKAVSLMEKELRKLGLDTLLCCSGTSVEDKKKAIKLIMNKNVDALILIGSAFRELSDNSHIKEAAEKLPVFIINGDISLDNVYCVLCDEHKAMYENVKYVVQKGADSILYLYDSESYSGRCKLSGFEQAVKETGLKSKIVKTEKDLQSAKNAVVAQFENEEFSAILTSEDLLAVGALKAIGKLNKKISVIGFNNSQLALCSSPSLTSVDNMLDELCPMTAKLLSSLLSGEQIPAKTTLYAKIVERDT